MSIEIEVCIDNAESLRYAINGGATRIELCSSLALGGLTPSYGFVKQALKLSSVPIYPIIRPRQGDFLYTDQELELMLEDIHQFKKLGVQGVVFGCLTSVGEFDQDKNSALFNAASGLQTTFHRAFDHCYDPIATLDSIIDLGINNILTSGQATLAEHGIEMIAKMVQHSQHRTNIMAGAGVNPHNVARIIQQTGVKSIHLSGKTYRNSLMQTSSTLTMGDKEENQLPITHQEIIQQVNEIVRYF